MNEALEILEERARRYNQSTATLPTPRLPGADALMDTAEALAAKHRLLADDGILFCWGCGAEGGTWPSLHCEACLAEHRAKPAPKAMTLTATRWAGMINNMREEQRLDRKLATKLLEAAKKVPEANKYHAALHAAFTHRFGEQTFAEYAAYAGGYANED